MMPPSLSARRAWIEISTLHNILELLAVALRKESVDRNVGVAESADTGDVALRKESVDRNFNIRNTTSPRPSRSPQGERG